MKCRRRAACITTTYGTSHLQPATENGKFVLVFDMEALGFGAVLAQRQPATGALTQFLNEMHASNEKPLSSFHKGWEFLPQHLIEIAPDTSPGRAPENMVKIPGNEKDYVFQNAKN